MNSSLDIIPTIANWIKSIVKTLLKLVLGEVAKTQTLI